MDDNHRMTAANPSIDNALRTMTLLALRFSYDSPARRTSRPIPARPVPAPRRISRAPYQETATPQVRSCSVPPPMSSQLQIGRELNVDDGLSIRSTSIQSLVSNATCLNTVLLRINRVV